MHDITVIETSMVSEPTTLRYAEPTMPAALRREGHIGWMWYSEFVGRATTSSTQNGFRIAIIENVGVTQSFRFSSTTGEQESKGNWKTETLGHAGRSPAASDYISWVTHLTRGLRGSYGALKPLFTRPLFVPLQQADIRSVRADGYVQRRLLNYATEVGNSIRIATMLLDSPSTAAPTSTAATPVPAPATSPRLGAGAAAAAASATALTGRAADLPTWIRELGDLWNPPTDAEVASSDPS
jgi:hypothetical protein